MAQQLDDLHTDPLKVKIQVENLCRNFRIIPKYTDNENVKRLCKLRDQDISLFEKCLSEERVKSIASGQVPKKVADFMIWSDSKDSLEVLGFCQPSQDSFEKALRFFEQDDEKLFSFSPSILASVFQVIDTFRQIEYHKIVKSRVSGAKNYPTFVKKMANQFKLLEGDEKVAGFTGREYSEFQDRVRTIIRHKSLVY